MRFLSPSQDLAKTLRALPGLWARLQYLAQLRQEGGDYSHWGLAHSHGELGARSAMQGAHQEVFVEVLRTPLRELEAELRNVGLPDKQKIKGYLERLDVVPEDLQGGTLSHFKSVVSALTALLTTDFRPIRPAA